nr:molybdopterin-dependent oxidoreductase [Hydrogenophaga sp.]
QIGKPGAGPFSLTGQPNAMGGREVGGLANLISAHRDMANPSHRAEVAALWGVADVPSRPGLTAVELFEAAADGAVKALWIACTNPAQSMPDQATVRRALQRAEFVVVQEAFATPATCDFADLLLPATTWGEKDGTVTNSERRISRVRSAVAAPGEARHDWRIAVDFARRLRPGTPLFPYESPESIWVEHRESTRGRDLDITGLSYDLLERQGPQQWPMPEGAPQGRARLYEDGVFPTPDGRARFVATPFKAVAEPRRSEFPFALTTGRLRDHWHGMSRTGLLGRLFGHVAEPSVDLHPQDMARLGLGEGDLVKLTSKRGTLVLPARASAQTGLAQAFVAMHWGAEYLSGRSSDGQAMGGINAITTSAFCPDSKQPELKHAAVRVDKAALPWTMLAMAWLPEDGAIRARERLRQLLPAFDFALCVPFGRERAGVLFRAAGVEAPSAALLAEVEAALGLNTGDALRYEDPRQGRRRVARRTARADGGVELAGFLMAGDTRAEAWLKPLLEQAQPLTLDTRLLLMPGAEAPVALPVRARQVCTCADVNEDAINAHLAQALGDEAQRLTSAQATLGCGTHCGSCVPELQRLARAACRPAAEVAI